eukprot:12191272-Karenia_brevis.AAC.1
MDAEAGASSKNLCCRSRLTGPEEGPAAEFAGAAGAGCACFAGGASFAGGACVAGRGCFAAM